MVDYNLFDFPECFFRRFGNFLQARQTSGGVFAESDFVGETRFAISANKTVGGTAEINFVCRMWHIICRFAIRTITQYGLKANFPE